MGVGRFLFEYTWTITSIPLRLRKGESASRASEKKLKKKSPREEEDDDEAKKGCKLLVYRKEREWGR